MKDVDPFPFSQILADLLDADKAFNPAMIYHLSSLPPSDASALARNWAQIPLDRRRSLVVDLESFAESDALLFFEDIGKIAISDADPLVRAAAIRLTAIEEDPDFADVLIGVLSGDTHAEVRAEAATALGKYIYLGEIEEIPAEVLHRVEKALLAAHGADQDTLVRRRALEAISFSSLPEVNGLIEDAFASEDEDWQASALFSMGASANSRWEATVLEMLDADAASLRLEAVRAAGKLGLHAAKPVLFVLAEEDDEDEVCKAAIWSLSEIGGLDAHEFIEGLLEEADTDEESEFLEEALDNLLEAQMLNESELLLFDIDEDVLNEIEELDLDEDEDD